MSTIHYSRPTRKARASRPSQGFPCVSHATRPTLLALPPIDLLDNGLSRFSPGPWPVLQAYCCSRAPKPFDMAPFIPGDWVTYSGIKNGPNEILCYEIIAENVQILTSADAGEPVYVRVEDVRHTTCLSILRHLTLIGCNWNL
jgi:hypothetical protein